MELHHFSWLISARAVCVMSRLHCRIKDLCVIPSKRRFSWLEMNLITSSLPPNWAPCGQAAFTVKFLCVEKDKSRCRAAPGRRTNGRGGRAGRLTDWWTLFPGRGFLAAYKYCALASFRRLQKRPVLPEVPAA